MNRQLFLATTLASTLLFSSSYAFTPTCKFFSLWCDDTSQSPAYSQQPNNPQAFSFTDFFNQWRGQVAEWKAPSFLGGGNAYSTQPATSDKSGSGSAYSPTVLNSSDPNSPKTSDFGVGKPNQADDTAASKLFSPDELAKRQETFNQVLNKCSDGSSSCIAQVTQTQKAGETQLKDPTNTNPVTPGSEYGGVRTSDSLTGAQSPNYDRGEDNHINSGPLSRGSDDSVIKQSTQNFNGSQYFVSKGTGICTNYGMDVGGSCPDTESYKSDFKATVSNLCSNLTGKRLKITSGNRSSACNARVGGASGSSHMSGLAMDTRLDEYSGDEKVIIVLYLAAQGFNNFGGYGPNAAMHFDMRSDVNRWGPNYSISSCESRLFPDYFRKAMVLMGSDPCQRDYSLRQKAINALNKMGKTQFTKPANNKVAQAS